MVRAMTNIHGIIGWPLGHTLSPALHNFGFRSLGIDATYEAWPTRPADLGAFMHRVREEGIRGVSVTIPHKRAVMEHLDELTYRAKSVGAVNTLFWEDGRLCGENTDISGLAEPLRKIGSLPESALILGAGGAARAAAAALRELGVSDVAVTNRTRSRADVIAHDFAVRAVDWEARMDAAPGLIINTTPLGMSGEMVDATPWEADRFPEHGGVRHRLQPAQDKAAERSRGSRVPDCRGAGNVPAPGVGPVQALDRQGPRRSGCARVVARGAWLVTFQRHAVADEGNALLGGGADHH